MNEYIAGYINCLGKFCGKRDVEVLSAKALEEKYQLSQVDVMVLFGGSILAGGDVLAEAMQDNLAKHYVIVGGAGHTTDALRKKMHSAFPDLDTEGLTEAEVFDHYIKFRYGVEADYLEMQSTNCGNNITYLLDLLADKQIEFKSVILLQDATMQHRMEAGLRKYAASDVTIINYATYKANVICQGTELLYKNEIWGMWDMDRYITLLMGEIPRLTDDENGYGPKGKGYIASVEIPTDVKEAFEALKKVYGSSVRIANPLYASKK